LHPKVIIIPAVLVLSGLICFAILPLSLGLRMVVLAADLLTAALIGFILWRQNY